MFTGLAAPLPYSPPWELDFRTRHAWLTQGAFRIAYIYELEDTSTFRYRVFNMVEALNSQPSTGVSAGWFTRNDFYADQSFVDNCDLLVLCRTRYDEAVARLVERARARGAKVLFDIDDLVVDPSLIHRIMDAIGVATHTESSWDYWFSYIGRLRATLDLCDGAITTNPVLAERITLATGGLPCGVVPNFLNRLQTQISDSLIAAKQDSGYRRDEAVTVGFLSGSPTHAWDLFVASPALAALFKRHPDVRLRMVGFVELNEYLKPFSDRIEVFPLQDYLNLQRVASACEFCIVPLQVNTFTKCKSELKFFENGAVGTPIVATPTPPYATAIEDGIDGFLAHAHEWHDKLEVAYELAALHPDEYRHMSQKARLRSLENYGWDVQVPTILRVIDQLAQGFPVQQRQVDPVQAR